MNYEGPPVYLHLVYLDFLRQGTLNQTYIYVAKKLIQISVRVAVFIVVTYAVADIGVLLYPFRPLSGALYNSCLFVFFGIGALLGYLVARFIADPRKPDGHIR